MCLMSLITDTGDYTVNLTNSFSNTDYALCRYGGTSNTTSLVCVTQPRISAQLSSIDIKRRIDARLDLDGVHLHGDLA